MSVILPQNNRTYKKQRAASSQMPPAVRFYDSDAAGKL